MMIQSYIPGKATKSMTVWDTNDKTDEEILSFAMSHAGLSRANLFGHTVVRKSMFASVSLYTD